MLNANVKRNLCNNKSNLLKNKYPGIYHLSWNFWETVPHKHTSWSVVQLAAPYDFGKAEKPTIETFWLLVLILLPHWCKISRPYLLPVPNYWTWTKTTPQKKCSFWSNPYKIEVMITSLIEMLEWPNFDHMTSSTVWHESHDKVFLLTSNYYAIQFILKYLYFKKA